MKEWYVIYTFRPPYRHHDGEECLVVLPSFRKLLCWFLRTARHCDDIHIFVN